MKIKEDSKYKRKTRISELKKIAPFAFDENNKLLSLEEQKNRQFKASLWGSSKYQNTPFIVIDNSEFLNIPEMGNKAILLTRERIDHIINKHSKGFTFEEMFTVISNLQNEISRNVLCYQDLKNPKKFCFVLNIKSENNNDLICVVNINFKANNIELNKIISIHGKKNLYMILSQVVRDNLKIYTNKRTGDWLAQQESQFLSCGTGQHLLNLYYKQNKVDNQEIHTNKQTKSYSSATRDPIASNKQVASDNPSNRSIDKQR